MNSSELRKAFQDFFRSKAHKIVPSAPLVIKNDPTLMFTNAGMNQFKDIFLGNSQPEHVRVANSQKCLRVSGKHNDLEEVGHDTYHHTMFEMLGNWSFGGYFKKEAIHWAKEFLVDVLKIPIDRLYATIFKGSEKENVERDSEAFTYWKEVIGSERILEGSKKDNFWEMGDTGPCGPCSEIHIDLRPDDERKKKPGKELVNKNHPLVIEIWNLVFIQYNRLASGQLESLPQKHVDTGMGFERLCMMVQGKSSNYDTDLFQPIIQEIGLLSGKKYGDNEKNDIAMRVVADHLRAVSFSIAEGQLPSNNKAGYVIRRILRRAIRYAYSFLGQNKPFIYKLVHVMTNNLGHAFPELLSQKELISKVIKEEEVSFLKTLDTGIRMLEDLIGQTRSQGKSVLSGKSAFTLYDTYGFPLDLTELIVKEHNMTVDSEEFERNMLVQKSRSRNAGKLEAGDWVELEKGDQEGFIGYDHSESEIKVMKYRKVSQQDKVLYHLIFNKTPFYAESGGQVGDKGIIESENETLKIIDTQKENEIIIHFVNKLPEDLKTSFKARVNIKERSDTEKNHSATHLLHRALREILGEHVEQKGSLVHPDYLRFDFSHFQKLNHKEIISIEKTVNADIRANFILEEDRSLPYNEAIKKGALALFGEKYAEKVRVIRFGNSIELCGGTHVDATGQIGLFKIISESSIAAGIRRIEAVTGPKAEEYILSQQAIIEKVRQTLKGSEDIVKTVKELSIENQKLRHQIEKFEKIRIKNLKGKLINNDLEKAGDVSLIIKEVSVGSAAELKDMAFQLRNQVSNLYCTLGADIQGKAHLVLIISDNLVESLKLDAGKIIKDISEKINGGGGGQPFLATAGGQSPAGIHMALELARDHIINKLN